MSTRRLAEGWRGPEAQSYRGLAGVVEEGVFPLRVGSSICREQSHGVGNSTYRPHIVRNGRDWRVPG
jgi:hypothetical protein